MEENTFLETCLPAPVLREAASSNSRRPPAIFVGTARQRVLGTLCSFAENEGDGGENLPKDLLRPRAGSSNSS